jgi:uncharacterized OsmC-like protein
MHNVRTNVLEETKKKTQADRGAATMQATLTGEWRIDDKAPQFGGMVKFPKGELLFEADFPPFLGGEGRAPSPLAYCFYGAMCCYGATFATQAALEGVQLKSLRIGLTVDVDFTTALGLGQVPPLSKFSFTVRVETDAPDADVQRIKRLADERCPAIWAMKNPVPHEVTVSKA